MAGQSAAVTPLAAPGSVTSPPHDRRRPAGPASQSTAVTPPAAPGSVTSPPHEIAGRRGAGLAIHRGHSPDRAGKRHIAGRPGSVTAPPATAFLDAICDPAMSDMLRWRH